MPLVANTMEVMDVGRQRIGKAKVINAIEPRTIAVVFPGVSN